MGWGWGEDTIQLKTDCISGGGHGMYGAAARGIREGCGFGRETLGAGELLTPCPDAGDEGHEDAEQVQCHHYRMSPAPWVRLSLQWPQQGRCGSQCPQPAFPLLFLKTRDDYPLAVHRKPLRVKLLGSRAFYSRKTGG